VRSLLLFVVLVAGCTQSAPPTTSTPSAHFVEPPLPGGAWREPCPAQNATPLAVDFVAQPRNDSAGHGPGLHRLDPVTFLWVYATYNQTDRQDRVSRVNPVDVARDPDGTLEVCTRVDLVTPVEVDGKLRTYDVAARFTATQGLPAGSVRFTVNWIAGCTPCDPLPRGNATVDFP
jgi:hypothetical protein